MARTLALAGIPMDRATTARPTGAWRRPIKGAVAAAGASAAVRGRANLYEVLRVKETASAWEIKSAYRSMAKRFHPDVSPADGTEFVEIHRAYAALSDPATRARYDRSIGQFGLSGEARIRCWRWETDQCW